jgi:hypothetical protein
VKLCVLEEAIRAEVALHSGAAISELWDWVLLKHGVSVSMGAM